MSLQQPTSLKENRLHGTDSFRCGYYLADADADPFTVNLHWHEEPEIIYFQSGTFTIDINMESWQIESECLFFVRSGELHRLSSESVCQESAIVFSPYLLSFVSGDAAQNEIIHPFIRQKLLLPRMLTPEHPVYQEVLSEYRRITERCMPNEQKITPTGTQQMFIKSALLNILGSLSEYKLLDTAKEMKNENVEAIKTVLIYIHEHYQEKLFIKDMAGLLNLNEQYFCRFFKKMTGQSPVSYLNRYRIRRALDMLEETDCTVTDICLNCGFNNQGNFLREFRKQTGTTPLQYRQQYHFKKSK